MFKAFDVFCDYIIACRKKCGSRYIESVGISEGFYKAFHNWLTIKDSDIDITKYISNKKLVDKLTLLRDSFNDIQRAEPYNVIFENLVDLEDCWEAPKRNARWSLDINTNSSSIIADLENQLAEKAAIIADLKNQLAELIDALNKQCSNGSNNGSNNGWQDVTLEMILRSIK